MLPYTYRSESQTTTGAPAALGQGVFSPAAPETEYSLFAPLHYEKGYAYPLLVWLHAAGQENERQLMKIMPLVSMRNYAAVAPRGFSVSAEKTAEPSYDWPQTPGHIAETERRVFAGIDAAMRKLHIAERRIFIAGFGAGGSMAFRLAMHHPQRFAGVISLCGEFPQSHCPLRFWDHARKMPVMLALGRDSSTYSPAMACRDLRLFHSAGLTISLRQYPCGQQLAPDMLRDLDRWIMDEIANGHSR